MGDSIKTNENRAPGLLPNEDRLKRFRFVNAQWNAGTGNYPAIAAGFERIRRMRFIPDLTGATFDMTLWTFLITLASGEIRQANHANNFTIEFEYTEECPAPFTVDTFYAGVDVGGLLNDAWYLEIVETR